MDMFLFRLFLVLVSKIKRMLVNLDELDTRILEDLQQWYSGWRSVHTIAIELNVEPKIVFKRALKLRRLGIVAIDEKLPVESSNVMLTKNGIESFFKEEQTFGNMLEKLREFRILLEISSVIRGAIDLFSQSLHT